MNTNEIVIKEASANQIPELKKIWSVCFGDSYEYINFFFENRFPSCRTLTALVNNITVGAVYLFPVSTYEYASPKKGYYGYAIGVLPEYRKQGIYAKMHREICRQIHLNNEFYILCPANSKLAEFYGSLGFREYSFLKQIRLYPETDKCEYQAFDAQYDEYFKARNEHFKTDGLIVWDNKAIDYTIKENTFCGGFSLKLTRGSGKSEFIIARRQNESITVIETTADYKNLSEITSFLCEKYNVKSVLWTLPAYDDADEKYLSAMAINLKKPEYPYLNLLLN